MKNLNLTLLFLFIAISLFGQKKNKNIQKLDQFADLDTTFNKILKDHKVAGFAIAVIDKNKIIYTKGFGFRDIEKQLPVTPNTSFAIASCTKAFTAGLLGILEKEGKIDFEKPVKTYLPDLKLYNDELTNNVTTKDLMIHRTGIPRHDYAWLLNPTTKDSIYNGLQYLKPFTALRDKWYYNNYMYFLQGYLTEKLTNKTWEENIKSKIFEPLGMRNTFLSVKDFDLQKEPAKPYIVTKDSTIQLETYFNIDHMGPAGNINSTVLDMSRWVQTWINGGKFEGKEILPTNYVTAAQTSQIVAAAGMPIKETPDAHFANYGYGWFLSSYKGHYRVEHGGNLRGFTASTSFFPTDSIGIVVLCNQGGSVVPTIVRNILADRYFNQKYYDWSQDRLNLIKKGLKEAKDIEKKVLSTKKYNTVLSHKLNEYEGLYHNPAYGTFKIFVKNDSLFCTTKNESYWLEHFHYDVFTDYSIKNGIDTTQKSRTKFQFITDIKGEIASLNIVGLEPSLLEPIIFEKKPLEKPLTIDQLKKYEGNFELSSIPIKVYIKDNKSLTLLVPNQPEYELFFIGNNSFNFTKPAGYSVSFEVNKEGQTIGLILKQPNGNFKAVKK